MMKVLRKTQSLCPECLNVLDAEVFERDGKVWIRKNCGKHGDFEELYWGSYEMYKKAGRFACDGKGISNPNTEFGGCPQSCGLCKLHKSHTCLGNIAVTNRCDLTCWYCFFFAEKAGYVYEPSLEQIRQMLRNLRNEKPVPANAVQLTGGEPALREDIIDVIKLCREEGFDHIQLNTNGIRLAMDESFAGEIRKAGVDTLYLSFDGTSEKTNPKNHWEIPRALENCRKAGIGVVLVPTVIGGVNDHEVGEIVKFALRNVDVIRGVNFQPVSLVGSMPRKERKRYRITIPDVIKRIEEQAGFVKSGDWYPVPTVSSVTHIVEELTERPHYELSAHFACGMATYLFKDGDRIIPVTDFVDVEGLMKFLEERADKLRGGKSRVVEGLKLLAKIKSFIDKEKQPSNISFGKMLFNALVKHDYSALGEIHYNSLFLGIMHFQDLYNYDIQRVQRCVIHYATPDPERPIVPFCAFNVIPQWYRDRIQKEHSISITEWEEKTGKKLKGDLYKRDIAKLKAEPVYRKVYG
ncbi:MAG: radical SAM protein [archaeon]|nr:MAG: radical SAM protein [archaeon]